MTALSIAGSQRDDEEAEPTERIDQRAFVDTAYDAGARAAER
jgi:hypothetical protein